MLSKNLADLLGKSLVTGRQWLVAELLWLQQICSRALSIAIDQSCDRPCRHSRDDLDRNANCKTKLAVSAPLIDGDFNKPI